MGSTGAIIMGFFGSALCIAGLGPLIGWTNVAMLAPMAIFAVIVARVVVLSKIGSAKAATPRAEKIILWSSVGEGVAMFVVANVLVNLGRSGLILPGIVIVVGLHFLPMAYAIPFKLFYAIGSALIVTGIVGLCFTQPVGAGIAGVAAAIALWSASVVALMRESKALAVL